MSNVLDNPLLFCAAMLFFIGLGGALTRRAWPVVLTCLLISFAGVGLAFVDAARATANPAALAKGAVLILLVGPLAVVGNAVAIAVYRRRGSVNLDELHELRG